MKGYILWDFPGTKSSPNHIFPLQPVLSQTLVRHVRIGRYKSADCCKLTKLSWWNQSVQREVVTAKNILLGSWMSEWTYFLVQKCTVEKRLDLTYVLCSIFDHCWKKTGYCYILTRNAREAAELGIKRSSNLYKSGTLRLKHPPHHYLSKNEISGIHHLIFLFTVYSRSHLEVRTHIF